MKNFGYQAERFRSAVLALMLPHPQGESESIVRACHQCRLAFQDLDRDDLDQSANELVQRLDAFMGPVEAGVDSHPRWLAKAEKLSIEQKLELSNCIYELNAWFHQYFWSTKDEA